MNDNASPINSSSWQGDERQRYARQFLLPEIGEAGQLKLRGAHVTVVGAGALGSAALYYLAAAGVGRLRVVDGDTIDASNLQRQILHTTAEIGRLKVESAREKLLALNPHVEVEVIPEMMTAANSQKVLTGTDFLVDATDNYDAKFMINDACVAAGVPFCHGSIARFQGQATTWVKGAPCYRCLFPEPPAPTPFQGPFGAVPGVIGSIQAAEAIKFITGIGQPLTGRLLVIDLLAMTFVTIPFGRDPQCPCCSKAQ